MKFSLRFILFLSISLTLLILGNLASLIYYAPRYFNEYVENVRKQNPWDESALINAFIESKDLDPGMIEEYRLTLQDLRDLTKSLQRYSVSQQEQLSNTESALKQIGFSDQAIRQTLLMNSLQSFLQNIVSIALSEGNTPERTFLLKLLTMVLIVNAGLISLILAITFVWTKYIFRPTVALSERLLQLIETRDYVPVRYTRSDEFAPLVQAVNSLSQSLALQEKIRSDFLSDFSHEIKTPIAALKVFLEWVEDGVVALDEKGLSIIRSELDRLLSTTDSIMQYEKVVALKEKHAQTTEFDITPILTNLRDEYLPTLARNSQMIRFEEKPFFVRLEKDLMIQMIHNVFSNFTKYAGQGATLTTRMARRSRRITFNFDDDGRGVAKENVPYLREKFYQEDSGRSGSQTSRGIGIGLSLIEKIAKVHGGHITIVSDTGRGFRLKVVLEQPDIPEQAMESPSEETLH